jgi:hypothetical protein
MLALRRWQPLSIDTAIVFAGLRVRHRNGIGWHTAKTPGNLKKIPE